MNLARSAINPRALALLCLLAVAISGSSRAAEQAHYRKATGEYWVCLGIMPAELITGPAPEASATPDQPTRAKNTHHVLVSIFNRAGRRIMDASVDTRVALLGLPGVKKTLEPTSAVGQPVYAGLFPMTGRGPFRIDVEFSRPGVQGTQRVRFYFRHPNFEPPKRRAL